MYIPIVLSLVMLAAHFVRDGNSIGIAAALVLIALLFVRQPWVARLIQVALVVGALEWVRTLYELAQVRAVMGEPYARMIAILGIVAVVTLGSALLFQCRSLKRTYRLDLSASG